MSGKIKVYKTNPDGKQYILRLAQTGDVLALETVFSGSPYAATAEIFEDSTVCFINKQDLIDAIHQDSNTAVKVMKCLARQLEESDAERVELAQGAVRERMARLLSLLSRSHGIPEHEGIRIGLNLSREEMAEMVGTAAETAIRLLRGFKEEHLLELQGKKIFILDEKRLAKAGNLLA